MSHPSRRCLVPALVLVSSTVVFGQADSRTSIAAHLRELPPFPAVDEASQDPDLEAVRQEVRQAVRAKDVGRLMSFVSRSVVLHGERQDDNWSKLDAWLRKVPHAED